MRKLPATLLFLLMSLQPMLQCLSQESDGTEIFSEMIKAVNDAKKDTSLSSAELKQKINQQLARYNVFAAFGLGTQDIRFLVETYRLDKQIGASSASAGSTTLVSSGSVPSLLGLALETGSILRTINGSSVTFRTNPTGLVKAMARKDYSASGPNTDAEKTLRLLRRFSVAATFDTGRGPEPGTFRANYNQLTEFAIRVDLWNRRDPRHPSYLAKWSSFRRSLAGDNLVDVSKKLSDLINRTNDPALKSRVDVLAEVALEKLLVVKAEPQLIKEIFLEYADELGQIIREDANLHAAAEQVLSAWKEYVESQKEIYNTIANSPVVTVEYSLLRPPVLAVTDTSASPMTPTGDTNLPDLSILRLIYSQKFIDKSELTVNAAVSIFNRTLPTMAGNTRDFQLGARLDVPLPEIRHVGKGVLTLSGLYVHLRQQPLGVPFQINGQTIDQKGNIGLLQAQYGIQVKDTGMRIPISLTYANRTELIKEQEIRGNIGITFDLDKLFAKP
jgi:hypothetical protein